MKTVAKLKKSEIYISVADVLNRYQIHVNTLDRWIKQRGFPSPRKIVGKRHFLLEAVDRWDCEQSGSDPVEEVETALGLPITSGVIKTYDDFVKAMTERRKALDLSCIESDALSGMQEGYTNKLENWREDYGRGMGAEIFPLWLGALKCGLVLVELPRRPRRERA